MFENVFVSFVVCSFGVFCVFDGVLGVLYFEGFVRLGWVIGGEEKFYVVVLIVSYGLEKVFE